MMGWICVIPILAGFFGACAQPDALAVGYVEGEFVLLAPIETARVESIAVVRGDRFEKGQLLVTLESRDAENAVAEARAAKEQAAAQLENLQKGKRPEEIEVVEATLARAQAQARDAQRTLDRQIDLQKRGFASQAELDEAATALDLANATVAELKANLAVARLPAREAEINAAKNRLEQAAAALENAKWKLGERTIEAPADGEVTDIILRVGEVAGPAAPVLSLLPDGAAKLKLYVPEKSVAAIAPGTRLAVRCDGCDPGQTATVSYVATEPEFTPPVIYSLNNRQKLVFLVEARPDPSARDLKPGQIVDVLLAPAVEAGS
jgi:HlyD family secretion protein